MTDNGETTEKILTEIVEETTIIEEKEEFTKQLESGKPKKKLSQAQLDGLARGRKKRAENIAKKKKEKEIEKLEKKEKQIKEKKEKIQPPTPPNTPESDSDEEYIPPKKIVVPKKKKQKKKKRPPTPSSSSSSSEEFSESESSEEEFTSSLQRQASVVYKPEPQKYRPSKMGDFYSFR